MPFFKKNSDAFVKATFLSNLFAKISSYAVLMYSISFIAKNFNPESFSLLSVLNSILGMSLLLDFGLGCYLTNVLASRTERKKSLVNILQYGLNSIVVCALLAGVIGLIFIYFLDFFEWHVIKNAKIETFWLMPVFGITVFLCILQSGLARISNGLHDAIGSNLAILIANTMAGVIINSYYGDPMISATYAMSLALVAPYSCSVVILLYLVLKYKIKPTISVPPKILKIFFFNGIGFFLMQLAGVISVNADPLIISVFSTTYYVSEYAAAQKYVLVLAQVPYLYSITVWPQYARLHSANMHSELKTLFFKTIRITFILVLSIAFPLLVFMNFFLNKLYGENIQINSVTIILFLALTASQCFGTLISVFLNGCGIVKPQLIASVIFLALILPLKTFAIINFGLNGMMLFWISAYVIIHSFLYWVVFKREASYIFT